MGSKQFAGGLGYVGPEEVAHRNNICLLLHHDHDDSGAVRCGAVRWRWVCTPACVVRAAAKLRRRLICPFVCPAAEHDPDHEGGSPYNGAAYPAVGAADAAAEAAAAAAAEQRRQRQSPPPPQQQHPATASMPVPADELAARLSVLQGR